MPVSGIDYHREKYALVALAEFLRDQEHWTEVMLSVAPATLGDAIWLGVVPPVLDPELDRIDPRYRYRFYTDRGGRIDLAARKANETLLVEGKGTSAKPAAAIEQLIGRTLLSMIPERTDLRYGILIPDLEAWSVVVLAARHPVLAEIDLFRVSQSGAIRRDRWGRSAN